MRWLPTASLVAIKTLWKRTYARDSRGAFKSGGRQTDFFLPSSAVILLVCTDQSQAGGFSERGHRVWLASSVLEARRVRSAPRHDRNSPGSPRIFANPVRSSQG